MSALEGRSVTWTENEYTPEIKTCTGRVYGIGYQPETPDVHAGFVLLVLDGTGKLHAPRHDIVTVNP